MNIDSCYRAGYVIKRHGLQGEVKVHLESALPEKLESIFLNIDGRLVPFFIEDISTHRSEAVIKFEDIGTPDQADSLAHREVFIPKTLKPRPAKKDFELAELIGFQVFEGTNSLGKVVGANDHALNPLLVVNHLSKELLIPVNDHFIKKIDKAKKAIVVELPDGFIDAIGQ